MNLRYVPTPGPLAFFTGGTAGGPSTVAIVPYSEQQTLYPVRPRISIGNAMGPSSLQRARMRSYTGSKCFVLRNMSEKTKTTLQVRQWSQQFLLMPAKFATLTHTFSNLRKRRNTCERLKRSRRSRLRGSGKQKSWKEMFKHYNEIGLL
jgi:hypothetical protein